MKTSSGSKKSHQYTHESIYHHNVKKDVSENLNKMGLYSCNNQSCVLSSKKWMKNLHPNLIQIRRNENMNTSSGSNKSHKYTHEYVYHHNLTKVSASNLKKITL